MTDKTIQTSNYHVLIQTAVCRRNLGDLKGAAEVYEHGELLGFSYTLSTRARADRELFIVAVASWPDISELKMSLAEVYEVMGEPRKALQLVYQGEIIILPSCLCETFTDDVRDSDRYEETGENG